MKRTRVDALTESERDQLKPWADRWIEAGLSCLPADRARVERGIRAAYGFAGYPPPKAIVWVDSPAIMAVAAPVAALIIEMRRCSAVHSAVRYEVRSAVYSAVDSAVGSAVDSAVDSAVYSAVDSAVESAVESAVNSAVNSAVGSAVTSAVDSVEKLFLEAISKWYYSYFGGRWWAGNGWGWGLAYITYFRDVVKLKMTPDIESRLQAYEDLMSAGWVWMHNDFAMVVEPQVELHREPEHNGNIRRLHNLSGPSIAWRDGTALWHIHGVQVPPHVVEHPESITVDEIQAERNAEVRRVMIDRFGAARYLRALDARVMHQDVDQFGFARRLLTADIGDIEPLTMVEVVNSTPEPIGYQPEEGAAGIWVGARWHKIYSLRVPPSMGTCEQALRWTFSLPDDAAYRPTVET